jgi:hypothetical protein
MARVGERRDAYRDLVWKPAERRSLLTYGSRWGGGMILACVVEKKNGSS